MEKGCNSLGVRKRAGRAVRAMAARLQRCGKDERGVAALEFALILPVMLTVHLGSIDVTEAISANRKIVLLARTLADLTSQNAAVTAFIDGSAPSLLNIANASKSVIAPLKLTDLQTRISSVAFHSEGGQVTVGTVCWSAQSNWTPLAVGSRLDGRQLPYGLRLPAGSSMIIAEVNYPYKPALGYVLTGPLNYNERSFMRPRAGNYVSRTDIPGGAVPPTPNGPCVP